jgi:hypothetical protein
VDKEGQQNLLPVKLRKVSEESIWVHLGFNVKKAFPFLRTVLKSFLWDYFVSKKNSK